jgi:hypothetical protein
LLYINISDLPCGLSIGQASAQLPVYCKGLCRALEGNVKRLKIITLKKTTMGTPTLKMILQPLLQNVNSTLPITNTFITLTAAESKWKHLKDILKSTDNKDTIPTNRPLHTALHFTYCKKELWNHIWKKPANSNWGT